MNKRLTQALIDDYDVATGRRLAVTPASPTFARAFLSRVFGVVLLAILATALIKCTA